jgi:hypothetical protein
MLSHYSVDSFERSLHSYFSQNKPVTLLYPEIEAIWEKIDQADDWSAFDQKIAEIRKFRGLYDYNF